MKKIRTTFSKESLDAFEKETGVRLDEDVVLTYTLNNLTNKYYLAFANDYIVVHNNTLTLDQGVVTPESLSYLDKDSYETPIEIDSKFDSYFEKGSSNG